MPASIAPFQVVITPVNYTDAAQREAARRDLSAHAWRAGLDAIARRSRRTSRRQVQGCRPGRHPVPHHDREEARPRDSSKLSTGGRSSLRRAARRGSGSMSSDESMPRLIGRQSGRSSPPSRTGLTSIPQPTANYRSAACKRSRSLCASRRAGVYGFFVVVRRYGRHPAHPYRRLINCEPADIAFINNAATALSLLIRRHRVETGRSGSLSGARISE